MTSLDGAPIFKGKSFSAKRISAPNVNSWNTTLDAGASLIGLAEEVTLYTTVSIAIKTDESGTLFMEESPDGTNWDFSRDYHIEAGTDFQKANFLTRRFYRTRFVSSSASPHTFVRLQTSYGNFDAKAWGIDANDIRFDPDDSRPVFIGLHTNYDADTSDPDWWLINFTYTGAGSTKVTRIRRNIGVYDDRATLFP